MCLNMIQPVIECNVGFISLTPLCLCNCRSRCDKTEPGRAGPCEAAGDSEDDGRGQERRLRVVGRSSIGGIVPALRREELRGPRPGSGLERRLAVRRAVFGRLERARQAVVKASGGGPGRGDRHGRPDSVRKRRARHAALRELGAAVDAARALHPTGPAERWTRPAGGRLTRVPARPPREPLAPLVVELPGEGDVVVEVADDDDDRSGVEAVEEGSGGGGGGRVDVWAWRGPRGSSPPPPPPPAPAGVIVLM